MEDGDISELLERASSHARQWLRHVAKGPSAAMVPIDELRSRFDLDLPAHGGNAGDVIDLLVDATDGGLMASAGGRFFGWVTGGVHPAGVAADWLVSAWDQNAALAACAPALAIVEEITGAWMLDLLRLPPESSFAFTTGCQMAHVTALAAARRHLLLSLGSDPDQHGLAACPQLQVIGSEHGHGSIDRAVRLLGIGLDNITQVPTVNGCTHLAALERELDRAGSAPKIVCLSAGDVNTGSFDDFPALIAAAHRSPNTWVHVDGAFGLWAGASSKHRHLVAGVSDADSWATDSHKMLNAPFDSGFVATRWPQAHRGAMSVEASYITFDSARDPIDWNPEWSRRARSVPVYAILATLGRSGVGDLIDRCCNFAGEIAERLAASPGIDAVTVPSFNQGLVRFQVPVGQDPDRWNDHVIDCVAADGDVFFTGTTYEGRRCMRISVCSWATTQQDVDLAVAAVRRVLAAETQAEDVAIDTNDS